MAVIYRCDRCSTDHTDIEEHGRVEIQRDYDMGSDDLMTFRLCKRCREAVRAFITQYKKVT